MMKILVIGSGGREHAVVKKIAESPLAEKVYALPGNPGMKEAECIAGSVMDIPGVVKAARDYRIDFAVVTPDDPLAAGMVDALEASGVRCFGPDKKAAEIESSKVFSKNLMKKYHIPTAGYAVFTELEEALSYVKNHPLPLVVKADGLAKGKGVVIAETLEQAEQALQDMLVGRMFGQSGSRVIVEEYLTGPEVSVLTLVDGKRVVPLLSAMDHKRALAGDKGPNTGGMGAVAPNPFYTDEVARRAMNEIFLPTVRAMAKEGRPFKGCLFFGLMLTAEGPKVLEYNARLGDPETQAVLPLLKGDLLSAMLAVWEGNLTQGHLPFRPGHACCVVLASGGYPGQFETGFVIRMKGEPEAQVYYAGVAEKNGALVTAGGRVMSLTACGNSLREAVDKAYAATELVHFDGMMVRPDIGARALEA
jgi:phosphoribosylamine--glycine ligase